MYASCSIYWCLQLRMSIVVEVNSTWLVIVLRLVKELYWIVVRPSWVYGFLIQKSLRFSDTIISWNSFLRCAYTGHWFSIGCMNNVKVTKSCLCRLLQDGLNQLLLFLLLWTLIRFHHICKTQVPVANGSGSYPFSVDVPRNTRFLFANKTVTPAKAIAKSIVRL